MARERVLQRQLEISDQNQTFGDATAAALYLTAQYRDHSKAEPAGHVLGRLQHLAQAATNPDETVVTPLPPALAWIHDGTPMNPRTYQTAPWKSPQQLMLDIELELRRKQHELKTPDIRGVISAVTIMGHSHPNTVCSGACKGALMLVSETLEREFKTARENEKDRLAAAGIFVRGSRLLTVSAHFTGNDQFDGYGVGAVPAAATAPTQLPSNRVFEYRPQ